MIEAAGRFGPGAKKPYQHELREKLLQEEVQDTKEMLKAHEKEWLLHYDRCLDRSETKKHYEYVCQL